MIRKKIYNQLKYWNYTKAKNHGTHIALINDTSRYHVCVTDEIESTWLDEVFTKKVERRRQNKRCFFEKTFQCSKILFPAR